MADIPSEISDSANQVKNKISKTVTAKRNRKRLVRYGLLIGNLAVVLFVIALVLSSPKGQVVNNTASLSNNNDQAINPLDPLSAADIAVNASRIANLAEATSVTNLADSVADDLSTPVIQSDIAAKPQILSSVIKTKADIVDYTTVAGDTLASLATKFGVTSDSIKWSNGLTSDTLRPGKVLTIPPVNGIVYTVKSGDTPDNLASKYSANKDAIIHFNDAEVTGLQVGEKILIPDGKIAAPRTTYVTASFFGSASYGGNGYDYGWCTWYVANRRAELGRSIPKNLGNAYTWYTRAVAFGLSTGTKPSVGAVMVVYYGASSPANHVSVVEQVNADGSYWVSEMNASGQRSITDPTPAGGWARINYHFYPSAGYSKFIY